LSQVMLGFRAGLSVSSMGLTLNVDAAATAFVRPQRLVEYMAQILGLDMAAMRRHPREWQNVDRLALKRLKQCTKGLEVEMRYRDRPSRKFTVSGFSDKGARDYM